MNRERKFRIWDIVNKEYSYSPSKQFLIGLNGQLFDGNGCSYDENHVIQEYSGLKDKDGKEIYEGDIVKNTSPLYDGMKFTIEYKQNGFYGNNGDALDCSDIFQWQDTPNQKDKYIKVIGNIFETPNLIK